MTCPINKVHKTFTSWVFDGSLKKMPLEACPECEKIWYADGKETKKR